MTNRQERENKIGNQIRKRKMMQFNRRGLLPGKIIGGYCQDGRHTPVAKSVFERVLQKFKPAKQTA